MNDNGPKRCIFTFATFTVTHRDILAEHYNGVKTNKLQQRTKFAQRPRKNSGAIQKESNTSSVTRQDN
jgi:hypothetical protein